MNRWIAAAVAFAIIPTPAHACSYGRRDDSEIKKVAKESFDRADAIVDLEAIAPVNWKKKVGAERLRFAQYKVLRSWKGGLAAGRLIRVWVRGTCDLDFAKGYKGRVLLEVDRGFLSIDGALNGAAFDQSKFDREIDALIGDDRTSPSPPVR